jgi:hypothetical protein
MLVSIKGNALEGGCCCHQALFLLQGSSEWKKLISECLFVHQYSTVVAKRIYLQIFGQNYLS